MGSRITHKEFIERLNKIKPNIKILSTYSSYNTKVDCECLICNYKWQSTPKNLLYTKSGCYECGRKSIIEKLKVPTNILAAEVANLTNNQVELISEHYNNTIKDTFHCKRCGQDFKRRMQSFLNHPSCPVCNSRTCIVGINDMWTTDPDIASMLLYPDDGLNYTICHGYQNLNWLCECGNIINQKIHEVKTFGLRCPKCGDGISFGNKFMFSFLSQLQIEFENEKTFEWSLGKRYDFYIPSLNCIIEMQGSQHYKDSSFGIHGHTYEEEHANDVFKENLARENGIINYILIDSVTSTLKHISNSIRNSELKDILEINNVDWNSCGMFAKRSIVPEVCQMWNNGKKFSEIRKKFKIANATIRHYLQYGNEIGLCEFNRKESVIRCIGVPVYCITTNETFQTTTEAENKYNIHNVTACCRGRLEHAGTLPDGTKLKWRYIKNN